jgi:hypothetical protein
MSSRSYDYKLISIYLSITVAPTWSIRQQWNACFTSVLNLRQSAGFLARGISPSQGRYLHREQHKHRINSHRHPCLEWDSNPRSQCSRGRRHFIPYTARSLWSAIVDIDLNVSSIVGVACPTHFILLNSDISRNCEAPLDSALTSPLFLVLVWSLTALFSKIID